MNTFKNFLKIFLGTWCTIVCIGCVIMTESLTPELQVPCVVAAFVSGGIVYLCFRRPKENKDNEYKSKRRYLNTGNVVNPNPNRPTVEERKQAIAHRTNAIKQNATQKNISVNISSPKVPSHVLSSMRSAYTKEQFDNDLRILRESIELLGKTNKLETFFSRHDLAMQKIANLEMAKQAGLVSSLPTSLQEVTQLRERAEYVLFLSYKKELNSINNLKTTSAKIKRIDKFIEYVKSYENELDLFDGYDKILKELYTHRENLNLEK